MRNQNLNKSLAFVLMFLVALNCDNNRIYDQYKTTDGGWAKSNSVVFNFSVTDTLSPYNLFINLRTTNLYPFNNIFVITELQFPHGKTIADTLEYRMADTTGKLLGEGLLQTKENKLWYKEAIKLDEAGNYTFKIRQAMRKNGEVFGLDTLKGVLDVGFRIEN